jgi:hypothetical protein
MIGITKENDLVQKKINILKVNFDVLLGNQNISNMVKGTKKSKFFKYNIS